jgi:hypothetical protein
MNKRLYLDIWIITYQYADTQTITIRCGQDNGEGKTIITIHNIYNLSPGSYNSQKPGILKILRKILDNSIIKYEYIVLGDFNLYYPL